MEVTIVTNDSKNERKMQEDVDKFLRDGKSVFEISEIIAEKYGCYVSAIHPAEEKSILHCFRS